MASRFEVLFGTPERAARTLADVASRCDANQYAHCDDCPLFDVCEDGCNVIEWLRGESE